jgi:hypothetical protein
MKRTLTTLATGGLALTTAGNLHAQYAPPPPPAPFGGFVNEWLRKDNPGMTNWDFSGSMRLRGEAKEGFAVPGRPGSVDFRERGADVNNEYLLGKLRIQAGYTESWWSVFVQGRSSFAVNDDRFAYANNPAVPGTVKRRGEGPESDTIDLQQAYVTVGNPKESPVTLKLGRQELIYGEERLVGAFGWNNIGRVFDAAKLRWQNQWFCADAFASHVVIPVDGEFNEDNDEEYLSGLYATTTRIPKTLLEAYFLSRNASPKAIAVEDSPQFSQPSARDIYTVGGRVKSKPGELGKWDYQLEGAYQFGNFRDLRLGASSTRLDQDAFMVVIQAGYTFTNLWGTPRLGAEYAFASGDSNPTDGKHETFDNLFPTNHKFYGYMDFVSLQNIHDVQGILQIKPHPRVTMALEGHGFWLADTHDNFYTVAGAPRGGIATTPTGNTYGINPNYSSFVGTELDFVTGVALTRFAQLEVGYGHFFVGDYISQSLSSPAVGSKDADYVYLQATVNF